MFQNMQPTSIGLYNLISSLGSGNFSIVKLAEHRIMKTKVAIKIIDKQKLNEENLQKVYREVEILKQMHHSNIVNLYQIMNTETMLYIVMEYVPNGELFDYITKNEKLSEEEARDKFRQILSAIHYCHEKHVVHRDLKAENILLDEQLQPKLADFGFSNFFNNKHLLDTYCGSPPYAAPEIFKGEPYHGPLADVWSLGVLLYVMVAGALPFDSSCTPRLRDQVVSGVFRIPFWMSDDCEHLIRSMMRVTPERRLSMSEIFEHPWTRGGADASEMNHFRLGVIDNPALRMQEGHFDEVVIELMKHHGLNGHQVLQSLQQCAYDNLTAIYLMLSQRLKRQRRSCPNSMELQADAPGATAMTSSPELCRRRSTGPASDRKVLTQWCDASHAHCANDLNVDIGRLTRLDNYKYNSSNVAISEGTLWCSCAIARRHTVVGPTSKCTTTAPALHVPQLIYELEPSGPHLLPDQSALPHYINTTKLCPEVAQATQDSTHFYDGRRASDTASLRDQVQFAVQHSLRDQRVGGVLQLSTATKPDPSALTCDSVMLAEQQGDSHVWHRNTSNECVSHILQNNQNCKIGTSNIWLQQHYCGHPDTLSLQTQLLTNNSENCTGYEASSQHIWSLSNHYGHPIVSSHEQFSSDMDTN